MALFKAMDPMIDFVELTDYGNYYLRMWFIAPFFPV